MAEWVAAVPDQRLPHLPQLLGLLQLQMLPQEAPLTDQRLCAFASPTAAALVRELHSAALQRVQQQTPQQQQQQQPSSAAACYWQHHQPTGTPAALPLLRPRERACSASGSAVSSAGSCTSLAALQTDTPTSAQQAGGADRAWLMLSQDKSRHGAVGAALIDAWPGRPRGRSATQLLVAGVQQCDAWLLLLLLLLCWQLGHALPPPPTPTAPSQSGKPFKLFKPSNCCSAGGLDLSWRGLKSVELYDPRSDSWSWGPPLPAALPFAGKERNACKARLHSLMDPAPPPPPSVSFLKSLLPPLLLPLCYFDTPNLPSQLRYAALHCRRRHAESWTLVCCRRWHVQLAGSAL